MAHNPVIKENRLGGGVPTQILAKSHLRSHCFFVRDSQSQTKNCSDVTTDMTDNHWLIDWLIGKEYFLYWQTCTSWSCCCPLNELFPLLIQLFKWRQLYLKYRNSVGKWPSKISKDEIVKRSCFWNYEMKCCVSVKEKSKIAYNFAKWMNCIQFCINLPVRLMHGTHPSTILEQAWK